MERTLFVFEGESREKKYFESLERAFFDGEQSRILVTFKNDIYELYKQLAADDDLNPFELIKELNPLGTNRESLNHLRRDQVSQIYLFFDMEPHDDQFDSQKLLDMLTHFDNETEHGKLFVSYPMIEAIRDIGNNDEYLTRTVKLEECKGKIYKELSVKRGNTCYQQPSKIDKTAWQTLITNNVQKANNLINGCVSLDPIIDQRPIAQIQLNQYLPNGEVAILSAFPIFLADYFGRKVFYL